MRIVRKIPLYAQVTETSSDFFLTRTEQKTVYINFGEKQTYYRRKLRLELQQRKHFYIHV